jgi:hypothetical protein
LIGDGVRPHTPFQGQGLGEVMAKLNRRSFLGRLAGPLAAVGALGAVVGRARAQGAQSDIDANDSPGRHIPYNGINDRDRTDTSGHGRGPYTGHTDRDNVDIRGHGRVPMPATAPTGVTDHDHHDQANYGRGGRDTGGGTPIG